MADFVFYCFVFWDKSTPLKGCLFSQTVILPTICQLRQNKLKRPYFVLIALTLSWFHFH